MVTNVVVVGTQWGDEGKGKIVDLLTERAKGVVRFQVKSTGPGTNESLGKSSSTVW